MYEDRLTDMAKLGAFRDFADAPKKSKGIKAYRYKAGISEEKKTSGHPVRTHSERTDALTKLNQ
jgi:hypothetical protein